MKKIVVLTENQLKSLIKKVINEEKFYNNNDDYYDDYDDYDDYGDDFADPGGRSALRASGPNNPRSYSCPTCGRKNVLTLRDRNLGYQCDSCADRAERGY